MIKTGKLCKTMVNNLTDVINKGIGNCMKMTNVTEYMDVDDFMLYKDMMASYNEMMELCVDVCKQMDEQSKMLEDLQNDMKKLLKEKA